MPIPLTSETTPLNLDNVRELQQVLGVSLPLAYAQFLGRINAASPPPNVFSVPGLDGSVVRFLGRLPEAAADLPAVRSVYAGRLPVGDLAVALAAGGNLIVLSTANAAVYFWDHENEAGDGEVPSRRNMVRLAGSFDEFLDMLRPFDATSVKLDPKAVISVKLKPGFADKFQKNL